METHSPESEISNSVAAPSRGLLSGIRGRIAGMVITLPAILSIGACGEQSGDKLDTPPYSTLTQTEKTKGITLEELPRRVQMLEGTANDFARLNESLGKLQAKAQETGENKLTANAELLVEVKENLQNAIRTAANGVVSPYMQQAADHLKSIRSQLEDCLATLATSDSFSSNWGAGKSTDNGPKTAAKLIVATAELNKVLQFDLKALTPGMEIKAFLTVQKAIEPARLGLQELVNGYGKEGYSWFERHATELATHLQSVREVSQLSRTALKDKYLQKYSSKLAEITSHLDAVISSIDSADAIKRSWSSPASASGMELHGKLLAERALKAIGEFGKELGSSLDEKDPDKKVRSSMFFIPWHSYGGSWFYPGYTPPSSHHSVPHGGFGGSGGGGIS